MKSKIAYLTLCLAVFASCNKKNEMPPASMDFAVQTLATSQTELNTTYPAAIKGQQDIEIRPKVSGHITALLVDEGAFVRKGQALFRIDATQYAAAANAAQAQVEVVKANISTQNLTVENKKMLREKGIISQYDYDMALNTLESLKAQLAAAQAQLTNAKDQLNFCTVTSPADGVIGEIPYRVGSLVSPSTAQPLTTVSNITNMYAYFSMSEKQMLELTRSKGGITAAMDSMPAVKLVLADGSEYPVSGTITAISGVIGANTGAVQMRATFANPGRVLRSGGSGSVLVPVKSAGSILVPQKAAFDIQDKKFVYVVGADSTIAPREIKVLVQNDGQNFIVTSGLKANERIVVEGVNQLKAGAKINPITPEQSEANRKKAEQDLKEGKTPGEN